MLEGYLLQVPPLDFEVPYSALAFPPGTVPRSGVLTFSVDDLAHALIVTGRLRGIDCRTVPHQCGNGCIGPR
ncbi:hypothetical protein A8926_2621 [Saccharopolyspora spinosa]|uniref:Uncharacterized protein n=1 Tax=Saccharopolyspora spinosa TaxID=60894 RepID=A0A2N3XWB3_SACSN|nr:hypothetical protein A8926_2621 [Saccharopolyspora spinosa]